MSFVNLPPAIGALFKDLTTRIQKLENVNRFFATVYPIISDPQPTVIGSVTGDIDDPKVGQIWLNTFNLQLRTVVPTVSNNPPVTVPTTASVISIPMLVAAPGTATSVGAPGQIAYDSTHFYVCIATNSWVRATLAAW